MGTSIVAFIRNIEEKTSNNQFNLTIPIVMVCAGRFARHKPRQALRAGIAG